jgi:hypothetical protein
MCLDAAGYLVELSNGRVARQGTIAELRGKKQLSTIIQTQDDTVDTEAEETISPHEAPLINEADLDISSDTSTPREENASEHNGNIGKLVDEETRAEGRVSLWTYWTYIKYAITNSNQTTSLLILLLS